MRKPMMKGMVGNVKSTGPYSHKNSKLTILFLLKSLSWTALLTKPSLPQARHGRYQVEEQQRPLQPHDKKRKTNRTEAERSTGNELR